MTSWQRLIDIAALDRWMDSKGLQPGRINALQSLSGGTQNILLRFNRGDRRYVLRRPPPHPRPESNEAMRREARVLGALAGTDVPHPPLIAACEDESVLGVVFYLMGEVDGVNPTNGLLGVHTSSDVQHDMGLAVVDAIAALGRVDYRSVGLEDFGKPDGYLDRQVARWAKQLKSYEQFDRWPGAVALPHLTQVQRWLAANQPPHFTPGIMHGDLHLGNVMFERGTAKLAAVIDWELATIGDPLVDLGWLLATWPGDDNPMASIIQVQPWLGFPSEAELVERYRAGSSRELAFVGWYKALACYKLAIILEGTHARACAGQATAEMGERMHTAAVALFQRAARSIGL